MIKQGDTFYLELNFPIGVYQYKFIVDGEWKCSSFMPTVKDEREILNNIVEVVNKNSTISDVQIFAPEKQINSLTQKKQNILEPTYSEKVPDDTFFNTEAPVVPIHYFKPFDINSNSRQKTLENPKFLRCDKDEDSFGDENNSTRSIATPPHINLDHLSTRQLVENEVLVISSIFRRKSKFFTVLYYTPFKKCTGMDS